MEIGRDAIDTGPFLTDDKIAALGQRNASFECERDHSSAPTHTRHPTPDTRHPTPDTRHPTPDTRFFALTGPTCLGRTQRSLVGHPTRTNCHTFGGAGTDHRGDGAAHLVTRRTGP